MKLIVELVLPSLNPDAVAVRRVAESASAGWKFVVEQPDTEIYHRTKLLGSLALSGADYGWLYGLWEDNPCCTEMYVNVGTPRCSGVTPEPVYDGDGNPLPDSGIEPLWPGYFSLSAVDWNHTDCKAEVREIAPRDGYDALFRVWNTPVNLLDSNLPGGTLERETFTALYPDHYTYQPNAQGDLVLTLPDGNARGVGTGGQEHYYRGAMLMTAALTKLLIATTYGTVAARLSTFLQSDFYGLAVNPVTGRVGQNVYIMAGSDAKRPASVTPAVNLTISLREMLEELRALHNVYYLIDPDSGCLRVEHRSWFPARRYGAVRRVGLNALKFPDALSKANNERTDISKLYGEEKLIITNNAGSDEPYWHTGRVVYSEPCAARDEKGQVKVNPITVSRLFTSLDAAYYKPESVPDDAIFVCELAPVGSNVAVTAHRPLLTTVDFARYGFPRGPEYERLQNNGYQSAAILFADYHRHGRSFAGGMVNNVKQVNGAYLGGVQMLMLSTTPTRRQEGIVLPVCCEDLPLNLSGYVRTNRFNYGELSRAEFDPALETVTLDVMADSRCQASAVQPGDPGENCLPKGTFIRTEYRETTGQSQCTVDIFADGNCGEYELSGFVNGC